MKNVPPSEKLRKEIDEILSVMLYVKNAVY